MLMSASALAPATILLLIVLMFVGGSPGGTAGGIKTSTLGVMIASVIATLRGKGRAEMFSHAVPNETIHRVSTILLLSGSTLLLGIFILLVTEKMASFAEVAFECTSAFGTVGLSLGITPGLTMWGKLVIAILMFVGRVGPVTLMLGAVRIVARVPYSYPEGSIMVG
jgi:trk system potassium uptake protein TrkH